MKSDSHEHLFFECSFSAAVWDRVKRLSKLYNLSSSWDDIIEGVSCLTNCKLSNIVSKLVLGACAYFIWQERNLKGV